MMTLAELECAERCMQQKWYELVRAEQQGASRRALERLYSLYMLAVEEYNRCSMVYEQELDGQGGQGEQGGRQVQNVLNPPPSAIGSFFGLSSSS
ncbi:MAG: hypothetical protein PVS3B1_20380 [Ktedonobacteraceae bacterium]